MIEMLVGIELRMRIGATSDEFNDNPLLNTSNVDTQVVMRYYVRSRALNQRSCRSTGKFSTQTMGKTSKHMIKLRESQRLLLPSSRVFAGVTTPQHSA